MARYFNGKEIELLAPVGTFEIFEEIIKSNCDAVYLGGSILNMRMIRKGYNLSNDEILKAIEIAHGLNKKVYVTVNNLFSDEDLESAVDYLKFLNEAKPDGLIIQDFSIFQLIKELDLDLELHSSVMMNVHNLPTINLLEDLGVTRVVTSREMDLQTIKTLHAQTDMEFEYFTHGDMCVSHGSQCLYSSMLFGMSSNRGRCLKPCRWGFELKKDGLLYEPGFPLAVKDMCLYEHLPEMIDAGVTSFKIEGRMREKSFIIDLINMYGDAIDRYIEDPLGYDRQLHMEKITAGRKRDLSPGFAFGNPGLSNINSRYEGTGKFYSTGKMFSTPTEEIELKQDRIEEILSLNMDNLPSTDVPSEDHPSPDQEKTHPKMQLAVKVNNMEQARLCMEKGVDRLYLSGDVYLPDLPFTSSEIQSLANEGSTAIYLALPKMMNERHFDMYDQFFSRPHPEISGILFTNSGALKKYRHLGYKMQGDSSLNVYNHKSADFYGELGADALTLSLEAPLTDCVKALSRANTPMEVIVHGTPTVLYLEHDLYENTSAFESIGEEHNLHVKDEVLVLKTDAGEYPVYKDHHGRNHMTTSKEICYLPILKFYSDLGTASVRIEGATYSNQELSDLIDTYQKALHNLEQCGDLFSDMTAVRGGFTLGALNFD